MGYCTLTDVKARLPEIKGTEFDLELESCVEEASAWIDEKLRPYTTVPLASIPEMIKHICANYSVGAFRRRSAPPGEKIAFIEIAKEQMDEYIEANYRRGTLVRV